VNDLDRATAAVTTRLDHEQARGDELIDHARELGALGHEIVEIAELDDGAGPLGRDEPAEDPLRQLLRRRIQCGDHDVGVGRERAADAADRVVARHRDQPLLAVARVPQLACRELEKRQRAGRSFELVEHVGHERRALESMADHLDGGDQRLAQSFAIGRG